jgi:NADPH:quinone reductase-like Zn-dependent oxidoreductase
VPKEDEVLVKVHASTVTRSDAMRVRSDQYRFARLATGLRRPRRTTLGIKFARDVVARADVPRAWTAEGRRWPRKRLIDAFRRRAGRSGLKRNSQPPEGPP